MKYSDKLLIATVSLAAAMLLFWYVLFDMDLNVPKNFPGTPISIHGFLIIGAIIWVLIMIEKSILKQYPDITLWKLTLSGLIIGIASEAIFQIVRYFISDLNLKDVMMAIVVVGLYGVVISFLVAHQLKTKNTPRLFLFLFIIVVVVNLIQYLTKR